MIALHEGHVAGRFDALEGRFKSSVAAEDFRLSAIVKTLGPLAGRTVLDVGAGKGRFARRLVDLGAKVVGLDLSSGMLAGAGGLDRVRGSACRLPFAPGTFDAAIAVEVFEHLSPIGVDRAIAEARRVLRPGGTLAVIDKNVRALDSARPWLPKVVVKRIDEARGRWMYSRGGPVRERWFTPGGLARRLSRDFDRVTVEGLLSPDEARRAVFRNVPRFRLMTLWTARVPGGRGDHA